MREMVEIKSQEHIKIGLIRQLTFFLQYHPISSISLISLPKRHHFIRLNCYMLGKCYDDFIVPKAPSIRPSVSSMSCSVWAKLTLPCLVGVGK